MAKPLTNEQIVLKIQKGENNLYSMLWEQNEKIITKKAYDFMKMYQSVCVASGVEVRDIIQVGYIALYNAVQSFKIEKNYKLLTYLNYHFKIQTNELLGIRTSKREPLNNCVSLNQKTDEDDNCELLELQEDINVRMDFEKIEEEDYIKHLRKDLEKSLDELPNIQAKMIKLKYFDNHNVKKIAKLYGISETKARNYIYAGINDLGHCNKHIRLLKYRNEMFYNYSYHFTGYSSFKYSRVSIEQKIVEKIEIMK